MGGQITALKVQKRNPQRVNVFLDGQFAFGLAAIEAAHLRTGQFLSDDEVASLKGRDAVERAADRALNLLSYRPRSQVEVRRRLAEKGFEDEAIDGALDRLQRSELVNDRAFARYWIENRFQFKPRGLALLRQELRQKGIDDRIIVETLAEYDENDAAVRAAEGGIRRLRGLEPAAFRRKLTDYLRRRGFSYSVIAPIVQRAVADHAPEDSWQKDEV
ncbi:MAG: RecX family transcriptional regulator [Anaerolineae bacterium]|nr:RecX family transcriptional regulator [Anaerolineae bacterium]